MFDRVPSSSLPVTLEQLKIQARYPVADTSQDPILTNKILAATRWIENYCKISLYETAVTSYYRRWYNNMILDIAPYKSSLIIKYNTDTDEDITLHSDNYEIFKALQNHGAHLMMDNPPSLKTKSLYPIKIIYTAGYGNVQSDIPADLQEAVLIMATTMEMERINTDTAIGMIGHLIHPYKSEYARAV